MIGLILIDNRIWVFISLQTTSSQARFIVKIADVYVPGRTRNFREALQGDQKAWWRRLRRNLQR